MEEYLMMSGGAVTPAEAAAYSWKWQDPYSLDVPKYPLYAMYEQANALDQLVTPSPPRLQKQLLQTYCDVKEAGIAPVLFIHSESMQTEKTKNMKLFAWHMQEQGVRALFLMPAHAIGDEHQKGDTPEAGYVVSRAFPQRRTPALVITSNNLCRLREHLALKGITPATTDLLCIDEVQLFTEQTPFEAVAALLALQQAGFSIVMNGIDYDFKADPFTHMHHLLLMSRFLPGWRTFQLTTMCRHCPYPARGSRRVLTFPDGRKQIADASSPIVMPGLSNYYAVCDMFHKTCTRLGATEHVRPVLPTTLTLEQISCIPWMQEMLCQFALL